MEKHEILKYSFQIKNDFYKTKAVKLFQNIL